MKAGPLMERISLFYVSVRVPRESAPASTVFVEVHADRSRCDRSGILLDGAGGILREAS